MTSRNVEMTGAPNTEGLLEELKAALHDIYGEELRGVYVYGSHARNEGQPESDVDVIIILDNIEDYWEEIQRTSHVISDLSLKYNVSISPVRINEIAWLKEDSPFLNNVRREAIPA